MGINYRKRILVRTNLSKRCLHCKKEFARDACFCSDCGMQLISVETKIYANYGKNGFTSLSYKMPDGTIVNSKGNITIPLAEGLSYTTPIK